MFGHFRSSRLRKTVSTKFRLHTADRVQNADYVQDADWVQCKMQTDKKNWFFFCRQKRGDIRFYKILILGKSPCLWYRWSRWDDYYLGGSREEEVMHPWGVLGGVTRTRYILGWGGAVRPLTWPRHWMNSFSLHLKCTFQDRKLSTFPTNGKIVWWLHDNR